MPDARFLGILDELRDLHTKKGADYGRTTDPYSNVRAREEWGIPGWVGSGQQRGEYTNKPSVNSWPGYAEDAYVLYGGFDWMTATVGGMWPVLAMYALSPGAGMCQWWRAMAR